MVSLLLREERNQNQIKKKMLEEITTLDSVIRTALGLGVVQWLAFAFSIIYVILAAAENIWCWFFGIISVVLAFIVYVDPEVRLYSDAVLQVFYVVMSIYGWWSWRQQRKGETETAVLDTASHAEELQITEWPFKNHLILFFIGSLLAFALGWFWTLMNAALPYIDAFTTSFSVIATILVARKVLENWLYWIVIDFVCIFVYAHRGLYLFSLLFFIYCVIAVFGYLNWRRKTKLI